MVQALQFAFTDYRFLTRPLKQQPRGWSRTHRRKDSAVV